MPQLETAISSNFERRILMLAARDLASRGHFFEAESLFTDVLTDSMNCDELELLGRVAVQMGNWPLARRRWERLGAISPNNPFAAEAIRWIQEMEERDKGFLGMIVRKFRPRQIAWLVFSMALLAAFLLGIVFTLLAR